MRIYAIGDLHLPGHAQKPMNVFGSQWDRHFELITQNWRERLDDDDVALIPGDISWAMHLDDALDDLNAIARLPGRKILLRGNHDYWWSSAAKVRAVLPPGMHLIQNDALRLENQVFCGSRGWTLPTPQQALTPEDEKILARECLRLRLSLQAAMRLMDGQTQLNVMTHYPPLLSDGADTPLTEVLREYPVCRVVYGHLHGAGIKGAFQGEREGISYHLTSCDALGFCPKCILA